MKAYWLWKSVGRKARRFKFNLAEKYHVRESPQAGVYTCYEP